MKLEDLKSQEDLDAAIQTAISSALETETAGLKAKVEELLSEKKTEAEKRKEAEEAAKGKELEAAKAAGKIEEVERALTEQWGGKVSKLEAQLADRDGEILNGQKASVLESLAGKFVSPDAAKLMLSNMVETVRSENGIVNNFKGLDGSVLTTDVDTFIEHLTSNDSFKPLLKGVDSSGGGASGGSKGAGGAGTPKTLAEATTPEARQAYFAAKAADFNGG
jgi:SMC interacting uncharacterized protein involved in chromosome segregation